MNILVVQVGSVVAVVHMSRLQWCTCRKFSRADVENAIMYMSDVQ